ncbi:hypothetical protein MBLNU459_g1806t2 [Dothideomycetes sp. NU459]
MSLQPTSEALPVRTSKRAAVHPFAPLSRDEIRTASDLIQSQWPQNSDLQFKAVTLEEPAKAEAVPFLDAQRSGQKVPSIDRRAFVNYYIRKTSKFHEAVVNLSTQTVERNVRLGANVHAPGDGEEIIAIEKLALEDKSVQEEIAKLQLPEGAVVICDPWIYGSDGVDDDDRLFQCFFYLNANQDQPDSNHYAIPLTISPVISADTFEVIRIDHLPTGKDNTVKPTQPWQQVPPNEYVPEAQTSLRTDLKPLHVSQPEGASFTVSEEGGLNTIEWQKWSFKAGFNQREGMVLYDVHYDGRSLFYRLSLSDMNIPYADPRHPYHKKAAFDLGDVGAGIMANDLKLGCDCLGSIHYLSGLVSNDKGDAVEMPNCVCVHEQDAGIGWKHTNYRTGRAAIVRNRELVLQSIITVANYEYILAFMFNQAGEVIYEVRATGILSTQPIDQGVDVPWGTVVHPGVLAAHHQHIFSLRVDPALEGHANRLVYDEAHPMPRDSFNPHGTGYITKETVVEQSGGYDLDFDVNRTFKIQNVNVRNPINGKPVAYKIHAPPFQKGIADHDSFTYKRAEFSDRNIYAVKHRDGEFYAGGRYTNQSRGGTGVRSWAERNDKIVDDDLVVFVQFGINHIPRIEDFPVMPCEIIKVSLKPVNFFDKNPALDVPPSTQEFNKSTLLSETHQQPATEAVIGKSGDQHTLKALWSYFEDEQKVLTHQGRNCLKNNVYVYSFTTVGLLADDTPEEMRETPQLPQMIGAIESPLDQQLFSYFMLNLSSTLNVYFDHRNPFTDIVLPMAIQHTGLMHALLSLSGSILLARQSQPSPDLILRQSHHFDKSVVVLRKDVEMHELQLTVESNTDCTILQTILHCIETISADGSRGSYRCHLQAAYRLINSCQSSNDDLQDFARQFLLYQTLANSISALHPVHDLRNFVIVDSPQFDLDTKGAPPTADLPGVLDGLISPFSRIRELRDEIRPQRVAGQHAWCADERIFCDAFTIEASLRSWTCAFPPGTPACYASLLYRQAAWIYLFRTMRPSLTSSELALAVNEGLLYLQHLLPGSKGAVAAARTWTNGILLPPLYILGCAAFEKEQRLDVTAAFDAIQAYSHMGHVARARTVVERVWHMMDQSRPWCDTWDWESIMTDMGLDILVS